MKKTIASLAVFFFLFSTSAVFAQMPVGVPVAPAISPSLERIGVVGAAQGQVQLTTPGQVGRVAQSGQPVFLGDKVSTDATAHLQILLLDETVFTIGPNSAITIDRFVYDPSNRNGQIKASVAKGVFRYVSGKIAAKNPDAVKVKLPTATLGFRGTIVGGSVGENGQGIVGLLGPGDNNDAGAQAGSFSIEGEGGGTQHIDRAGFGVGIGEGGSLTGPFQMTQDQVNQLTQGLGGAQGGGQGGGGQGSGLGGNTNMSNLSGETGALTGENSNLASGLSNLAAGLNTLSDNMAQENRNLSGETPHAETSTGNTTYEQLRGATGSGNYASTITYSPGLVGNFSLDILFGGSGHVGGGSSAVSITQNYIHDSVSLPTDESGSKSFSNASGPTPTFTWLDRQGEFGKFDVKVTLSNVGDVVAGQAAVEVTYKNTSVEQGPASGTATATPKID